MMRRLLPVFLLFGVVLAGIAPHYAGSEETPTNASGLNGSPYLRPELRELMAVVTYRLRFDGGRLSPDMAVGSGEVRIHVRNDSKPEFEPGLIGEALVLGSATLQVPCGENVPLDLRGAVVAWIKPVDWRRPRDGNVQFFNSAGRFILQRQGPLVERDGRVRRHEHIQYLVRPGPRQKRFTAMLRGQWQNDRWYLLVANWSWPEISWSINAGGFSAESAPAGPKPDTFRWLMVGSTGAPKTLMDEVLVFRRPLSIEEVRLLYESFRPMQK